jgi:hypothetical protein
MEVPHHAHHPDFHQGKHRKKWTLISGSFYGQPKENTLAPEAVYNDMKKRGLIFGEDIFDFSVRRLKMNTDTSFSWVPGGNKLVLLTKEKEILKKYVQIETSIQAVVANYLTTLVDMNNRCKDLLLFLQQEYHAN